MPSPQPPLLPFAGVTPSCAMVSKVSSGIISNPASSLESTLSTHLPAGHLYPASSCLVSPPVTARGFPGTPGLLKPPEAPHPTQSKSLGPRSSPWSPPCRVPPHLLDHLSPFPSRLHYCSMPTSLAVSSAWNVPSSDSHIDCFLAFPGLCLVSSLRGSLSSDFCAGMHLIPFPRSISLSSCHQLTYYVCLSSVLCYCLPQWEHRLHQGRHFCLFHSLLHLQVLEWHLAHRRGSTNTCRRVLPTPALAISPSRR